MPELKSCHDCGVKPGEFHLEGCDTERCPGCGGQFLSCGLSCIDEEDKKLYAYNRRKPWTGIWPGVEECEKYNLWSVFDNVNFKWLKATKDTPGATHDLNSLTSFRFMWDIETQMWWKRVVIIKE